MERTPPDYGGEQYPPALHTVENKAKYLLQEQFENFAVFSHLAGKRGESQGNRIYIFSPQLNEFLIFEV